MHPVRLYQLTAWPQQIQEACVPERFAVSQAEVRSPRPWSPLSKVPQEDGAWETNCPAREDNTHCVHWYDGGACCGCGDPALPEEGE